ncbi:MAG: coiled-coil domain-containing protein [Ignavibacterium sp.]|uniref:coiled-coil domain-containing protein n=1 Tax=Ignavibacterium sp. TaxID=2651167 RepID=UPI00404AEE38
MKKLFLTPLLILFIFSNLKAQSDYEIVQSFKNRYNQFEQQIKNAVTVEELNLISADIERFKNEFSKYKDLLDRSLYPDNFEKSFEKLGNSLILRKTDFIQIETLQTEVVELRSEVDELNKKNAELLSQIQILEVQRKKDAETIAKLEKLVSELRASLKKRDELVYAIIDSLAPKLSGDVSALTQKEKEQIIAETEKKNVLYIVKKSLRDNNRFLEVTTLKPEDLNEVKQQQSNFVSLWQKIGNKLVDVYAGRKDKSQELKDIDALFTGWRTGIQREAWESIREDFALNNINLQSFYNGNEFTEIITAFINDEIKSYGVKNEEESQRIYSVFVDSVWYKTISNEWLPYLLENNMLTTQQKEMIEKKIAEWKETISPKDLTLIYVGVGVVIVLIVTFFLLRKKNGTKAVQSTN